MMKWKIFLLAGAIALITGCTEETKPAAEETKSAAEETKTETEENSLKAVAELLGKQDGETEDMLGGGEENWTEDRSFYIGRIFQADIFGENYPVYTTCSEDGVVESVSVHMVSGERKVTDDEIELWTERISEYTGAEPSEKDEVSEGGSRKKSWTKDGKIATLYYMEDNLSLSFQKQVGELNEPAPGSQE